MRILFAVVLVSLFSMACGAAAPDEIREPAVDYEGTAVFLEGFPESGLYYYHDDKRNVSCWILTATRTTATGGTSVSGALDCLPNGQVNTR